MTDDWHSIQETFFQVLELTPQKRRERLEEVPEAVRIEVEALLAAHARNDEFLETPLRLEDEWRRKSSSQAPRLERGTELGKYTIVDAIGAGGMGRVYLAEDNDLGRRVALKLLPASLTNDERRLARVRHEARLLASIDHPGIATVHSLEEVDENLFFTMEYIEGATLAERAERGLTVRDLLAVMRRVAIALEAAHERGIIHCDLKPDNVICLDNGGVKLVDFGLGKDLRGDLGSAEPGRPEEVRGTPGYMSPEQLRGERLDHRTDIWSFGCILYRCLSGAPAFSGRSMTEVIDATLHRDPDYTLLETAPESLARLIASLLTKDREQRMSSLREIRRRLDEEVERLVRATPGRDIGNIPSPTTSFIGRDRELENVRRLLADGRIVTLTGVGGCGKTRLALELARADRSRDALLVDLTAAEPELVPQTVAEALGLDECRGVPLETTIAEQIGEREMLLVIDNCEHLLEPCRVIVSRLLADCPELRILATSRQPLAIPGEQRYPVPRLELPTTGMNDDELLEVESVKLFLQRSRAAAPHVPLDPENRAATAQLCRLLEGIPLALELAAARVAMFSPVELVEALQDRFRVLARGESSDPPHHQSLGHLLDWSYQLLTDPEKLLLRRLSVFRGGWTLVAAEEVCGDHGVEPWEIFELHSNLIDKSLIEVHSRQGGTRTRYGLLDTVREYASLRLQAEDDPVRVGRRHLEYFRRLCEESAPELEGPRREERVTLLATEHDNLRAALAEGDEEGESAEATEERLRVAAALGSYWILRGFWSEGQATFERLLEQSSEERSATLARVTHLCGSFAYNQGDFRAAQRHYTNALDIFEGADDPEGIVDSLNSLGNSAWLLGERDTADSRYERGLALARRHDYQRGLANSLLSLGTISFLAGDPERAEPLLEESLSIWERLDNPVGRAKTLNSLGMTCRERGEFERGTEFLERSLEVQRSIGDEGGCAASLNNLGLLARERGDLEAAMAMHHDSFVIEERLGDVRGLAISHNNLGLVSRESGDLQAARQHHRDSVELLRGQGTHPGLAVALQYLAMVESELGEVDSAYALLEESVAHERASDQPTGLLELTGSFARLSIVEGKFEQGALLLGSCSELLSARSFSLPPEERRDLVRRRDQARDALGETGFDEAYERGRSLELLEAVELALKRSD